MSSPLATRVRRALPIIVVSLALAALAHPAPPRAGAQDDDAATEPRRRAEPDTLYRVEFPTPVPQRGPRDALVTMVMWSDFQCPFCSRVEATLGELRERYPRDLRIVWLNNPMPYHDDALPAARLALEAFEQGGNEKFWEVHDLLFESGTRRLSRANLERIARTAGLDLDAARTAIDTEEHDATIAAQQALARRFGAGGTPAFFVNGHFIAGARPLDEFVAQVEAARLRAFELLAGGVPRHGIYARTIAPGATEAPAEAPAAPATVEATAPGSAPTRGPRDAPIVIQIVSDFQCPFCSRALPTLERIMTEYPRDVRLVWRDYPLAFHRDAMLAHEAAREVHRQAGNAAFWAYHDLLFANQRDLSRDTLERLAREVRGVSMPAFRRALDTNVHRAAIQSEMADIRRDIFGSAGVGTPTFVINDEVVRGAQPFEAFRDAIARARGAGRP